jgi:hypothetical protein
MARRKKDDNGDGYILRGCGHLSLALGGGGADVQDSNPERSGVGRQTPWWWTGFGGDGGGDTGGESEGRGLSGHSQCDNCQRIPHFGLDRNKRGFR